MVEEIKTTPTPEQSTATMIEQARSVAERIEKANAEHLAIVQREENLKAQALLGGRSQAGSIPATIDPDAEDKAYRDKIMDAVGKLRR